MKTCVDGRNTDGFEFSMTPPRK